MPKKCKRCGTVNDSDARYCKRCNEAFPSGGGAGSSRTRKPLPSGGGGSGKSVFCKKCNKPRRVTGGPFYDWVEPDGPINQYEEQVGFYTLECPHKYSWKTGKTRPWKP